MAPRKIRGARQSPKGWRRGWRWCALRTIRDARHALSERRPIPLHQLRRIFLRRWQSLAPARIDASSARTWNIARDLIWKEIVLTVQASHRRRV
jgi:hypothetical protein